MPPSANKEKELMSALQIEGESHPDVSGRKTPVSFYFFALCADQDKVKICSRYVQDMFKSITIDRDQL